MNYQFRRVAYNDKRYGVVIIDLRVIRIRRIDDETRQDGSPLIWQQGDPTPGEMITIASRAVGNFAHG